MWGKTRRERPEATTPETANARYRRRAGRAIWPAMVAAIVVHYAALAWLPGIPLRLTGQGHVDARPTRSLTLLPKVTPLNERPPAPTPAPRRPATRRAEPSPVGMPAPVPVPVLPALPTPPEIVLPTPEMPDLSSYDLVLDDELPPVPTHEPERTMSTPASEPARATSVVPDVRPELENRAEVARALRRHYPPRLVAAGIGGTVVMWFWIDENGKAQRYELKTSSGHPELDAAAERVVQVMRFSPAVRAGQRVAVLVEVPIVFEVH